MRRAVPEGSGIVRPILQPALLRPRIAASAAGELSADQNTTPERRLAIERAVRAAAMALLERQQTAAQVVAALKQAVADEVDDLTPRERIAAGREARREEMLAEMERHEREGRGKSAATLVARRFAADPRDPTEVESLATKLRRWRREISGQCPVAPEIIE